MRIKQIEVCGKALDAKFCMFLTKLGTVTNLGFFGGLKIFKKKYHQISRLTMGYLWQEYEKF